MAAVSVRRSIGDKARISKYKRKVFDKGYTPNWTEEIFVVDEVFQQNLLLIELLI